MKIIKILLVSILFFAANIIAQNNSEYLISVSLNDSKKLNQIEELNIPIVYINDDQLITLVNSEKLTSIKTIGIDYQLLDESLTSDNYFLVSSKNDHGISSKLINERVVYTDHVSAIVKNISLSQSEATLKGLKVIKLLAQQFFKNEKRILLNKDYSLRDSLVTQITTSVNQDSVRYFIQSLQDFQTRFLFATTRDSVALWIKYHFMKMGFTDVVIDSFQYQGTWQKNVIATLTGIFEPEVYNIVGGHHDSYSSGDPLIFAPGADDNASGTAAVLEIARVIMQNNYQPESTIKFITFGAEEYGLWGSKDYAQKAFNAGMNIKIMINHDMISHTYSPLNSSMVDINRYTGFEYLRDIAWYCIENYSLVSPRNGSVNSGGSDSYSFWQLGFPSVYFEETDFSPYYHSPADTIGNYSMEYCAEVIKSSCATLLLNIVMPSSVQNYKLYDAGTGNSVVLEWSPNSSPDFSEYKIYFGTQSGIYDTTYTTSDTTFAINELDEGILYYVGVSAIDLEGYESTIIERSAIPYLLPLPPSGFTTLPDWGKVDLEWFENKEYDLLGYNLYRSEVEGLLGEKLNSQIFTDTTYSDLNPENGTYYYYTVKAVDSLLNESENNVTLRSRVISLDQGILIVDETADGDGSPMNPTDEQVDEFYANLLSNFKSDEYDLIEEQQIGLADLGAYSTVIWHGNDMTDMSAPFDFKESIIQYLNTSGNFLYTGYRPSKAFENVIGLNGTFEAGDFVFDYLKIEESKGNIFALFKGALNIIPGYRNIFVDSGKTLSSNQYHLKDIEMIKPNSLGVEVYTYETDFDSTTQQGFLKGEPVGVEFIGTHFRTVTISYPLYYMNQISAKELIEFILTNRFDEVMPVEGEEIQLPVEYSLEQNFPNPFNPTTTIRYSLPDDGYVKLIIYNLLGQEIISLVNADQKAGVYNVKFDASELASGIYIYRLKANNFSESKKILLVK
ncbi:MAG: M20/M25/M40 family metallo-hydrolase [Ignavibacteriaceae bacterium]|nr:M20/M25/M40 family metallo-hydrolase [Ignavibacteria bacterium]MBT8390911.1 M20/M25/M40 family metallo-hydrolase [Ignavibacteria bacterium]NNL20577.1 M20/M25/M40 family metallo-hydrolase [Ignavibacteriaceae bacterium]